MPNAFENRILNVINEYEGIGVTIQDIAKLSFVNRITAAKYLAVMEVRGVVQCRRIGRAKLYLPNSAKQRVNSKEIDVFR